MRYEAAMMEGLYVTQARLLHCLRSNFLCELCSSIKVTGPAAG